MLNNSPYAMQEMWVQSLGWEDPLEKEIVTHSSILAWSLANHSDSGPFLVVRALLSQAMSFQFLCSRLEALVPSRDSRARTRSPSPRAWRPDFPGAAREAP